MGGGVPAGAVTDGNLQRHVKRVCAAHFVAHQGLELLAFTVGDFEQKFVVNLQQHPRCQPRSGERCIDPDHRDLDDVGRAALDRRVERCSLGGLAHLPMVLSNSGR